MGIWFLFFNSFNLAKIEFELRICGSRINASSTMICRTDGVCPMASPAAPQQSHSAPNLPGHFQCSCLPLGLTLYGAFPWDCLFLLWPLPILTHHPVSTKGQPLTGILQALTLSSDFSWNYSRFMYVSSLFSRNPIPLRKASGPRFSFVLKELSTTFQSVECFFDFFQKSEREKIKSKWYLLMK